MRSILVIGGGGTFGGRLVRLLAQDGGCKIIIGGRDAGRAAPLLAKLSAHDVAFQVFDRLHDVAAQLGKIRPWLVIDAAGPFQSQDAHCHAVPEACIGLGLHYIDLADSRAFVTGIGALDAAAKAAGISIITGASSVPALSMAVVGELARDIPQLTEIDIALSASNRATAGPSVTLAILSYVGRQITFLTEGVWRQSHGWQKLVRKSFAVTGRKPIRGRWVGLCDVPDLDLLPCRYPEIETVIFRAGAELAVQNIALWLASFAVRWGLIRNLPAFGPLLTRLQRVFDKWGTDRSAMSVVVTGRTADHCIIRNIWTLLAEDGHGPWVPCFAAAIAVRKLVANSLPPGAFPANDVLTLADFSDLLARFHLFTEIRRSA